MNKGARYTEPLSRKGPKTGRRYASKVSFVRSLKGQFSANDLPFPNRRASRVLLNNLRLKGELEVLEHGCPWPGGTPTIYRVKAELRERREPTLDLQKKAA